MSKNTLLSLTIFSVLLAVGAGVWYKSAQDKKAGQAVKAAIKAKPEVQSEMTEKERLEYVAKFIKIENMVIEPDTQIGPDGEMVEIKGLLQVKGMAKNVGEKTVTKVQLVLLIKNDEDKVIATDIEDILHGQKLLSSEERNFSFKIRDRKEFTNRFEFKLR